MDGVDRLGRAPIRAPRRSPPPGARTRMSGNIHAGAKSDLSTTRACIEGDDDHAFTI
jgi:hypothetical protein